MRISETPRVTRQKLKGVCVSVRRNVPAERGDACMRGGGGGRPGGGVKRALGLGRELGRNAPAPDGPWLPDTLVEGVGGLIDEDEDEDGGLTEVPFLIKAKQQD